MGLRETYGGMLETALNAAVDANLDAKLIKDQLNKMVAEFVDSKLEEIKHKLKADIIDQIDGQDDIK